MSARYILFGVAAVFLTAAMIRMNRDGWRLGPASRAWLLVAVIFCAVAIWLSRTA